MSAALWSTTGIELARADSGSALHAVVFPAVGWHGDVYVCAMSTVSRITLA